MEEDGHLAFLGTARSNNQHGAKSENTSQNTGLFEMIVGVLTNCHLVLQMQPHVISFYGVTSKIRIIFLLFPQVSRN